ncbi:helix-turn-helix transcriptional regulator [Rugosimonospora africana]|uniref:HTH luxR-type domain-containing protein n=1 Tax=Rugosimonospora africana TaxID=556532 RepID=A0A8J3R1K5_9ACTN|nr:LuxR C-terminal-related transcriptional regulator [Rugosimonospora africana]GIH19685.1 hypothetical protein Raf01_78570 [Rugosimonospora africana]
MPDQASTDDLIVRYTHGSSIHAIATETGLTHYKVRSRLMAAGVELRTGGPAPRVQAAEVRVIRESATRALPAGPAPRLIPRHLAILHLLADGGTDKLIAETLHLSPAAVSNDRQLIYGRLGARNGAHAVALAIRYGLLRFAAARGRR